MHGKVRRSVSCHSANATRTSPGTRFTSGGDIRFFTLACSTHGCTI